MSEFYQVEPGVEGGEPSDRSSGLLRMMREMAVGDSFLFPLAKRGTVQTYASVMKHEGKVFTIRRQDGESARCWRKV